MFRFWFFGGASLFATRCHRSILSRLILMSYYVIICVTAGRSVNFCASTGRPPKPRFNSKNCRAANVLLNEAQCRLSIPFIVFFLLLFSFLLSHFQFQLNYCIAYCMRNSDRVPEFRAQNDSIECSCVRCMNFVFVLISSPEPRTMQCIFNAVSSVCDKQ